MKKILYLITILVIFSGCKKGFFELERPPQKPWQNVNEIDRAAIGAYNKIFANGDWGNNYDYITIYKSLTADDAGWVNRKDDGYGWHRDTEHNKGNLDQVFGATYEAIASCNDFLQFAEGNPFPDITEADKKNNFDRVRGEMYFMRGYCYYTNATLFCNAYVPGGPNDARQIPLIDSLATGYAPATNPYMGTVAEIWDRIIRDLLKAYELLPKRYVSGAMHPSYEAGRANKFAAAAMLARAYFQMGNYPEARKYADFVITQNGGDYDLSEDPIEAFTKDILGRAKEVIMYIPVYDRTFGKRHYHLTVIHHFWGLNAACPWTGPNIGADAVQRIGWMNDPTADTTILPKARRDKRFQQVMAVREKGTVYTDAEKALKPGLFWDNRKDWTSPVIRGIFSHKLFRGNSSEYSNIPIIRLAEMYLTRSICALKAGDKPAAAADLNVVKKRAFDATVGGMAFESSPDYATAANITEEMINNERLIELYCEGDRLDYMRGLKGQIPNGERGPGSEPYTSKKFVWPVPLTEKNLNNNYPK